MNPAKEANPLSDTTLTTPTITATLYAGRKVGLPNFSNKEAGFHVQIVTEADTPLPELEEQVDAMFRFIEAKVASRLGLTWSVDEKTGQVVVLEDVAAQNPAPSKAPARRAPARAPQNRSQAAAVDRDALWGQLQSELNAGSVTSFYDNRETKQGKQPDFKHKQSGTGLWLDNAPDWFGEGEVI